MTARSSSTDIEDVVPQAQSAAMTTRAAADYSTVELLAMIRPHMEAHWGIRFRDDLTTEELLSLARAFSEDVGTE